jgi:hypothetical protein
LNTNWNINEDSQRKAKENGIEVVYNKCMMKNNKQLFTPLGDICTRNSENITWPNL